MSDTVKCTSSGYWEATTDAPHSPGTRWTRGLFHDEQEAQDWLDLINGLRVDLQRA